MHDERKMFAAVAVLVIAAAAVANLGAIGGDHGADVSGFVVLTLVPLAIAAVLFLRRLPRSRAAGNPPRDGIIAAILGMLSIAVFWTNLPYVLGVAGIVFGMAGRDASIARGSRRLGTVAMVVGALAVVGSAAVLVQDEASFDGEAAPARTAARAAAPVAAGTVLEIGAVKSGSGAYRYDVKRLRAKAGTITIAFDNGDTFPHNVRVQTGSRCCFGPGNKDVGGTNTIDAGARTRATLTLEPGRYVFLCSIGGHWNGDGGKMRGTLVVTGAL